VTLPTFIRELRRSNLGWNTGYPDKVSRPFSHPLQANTGIVS
jgi:hypothetical protein